MTYVCTIHHLGTICIPVFSIILCAYMNNDDVKCCCGLHGKDKIVLLGHTHTHKKIIFLVSPHLLLCHMIAIQSIIIHSLYIFSDAYFDSS